MGRTWDATWDSCCLPCLAYTTENTSPKTAPRVGPALTTDVTDDRERGQVKGRQHAPPADAPDVLQSAHEEPPLALGSARESALVKTAGISRSGRSCGRSRGLGSGRMRGEAPALRTPHPLPVLLPFPGRQPARNPAKSHRGLATWGLGSHTPCQQQPRVCAWSPPTPRVTLAQAKPIPHLSTSLLLCGEPPGGKDRFPSAQDTDQHKQICPLIIIIII